MKRGNLHLLALLLLLHPLSTNRATAQLTPDNTLGTENSLVTPEATRQLIQGGATRGSNLFHSFTDFNVGENQRVYFANPTDITNILTRVTGNNLSNILGTLGVDGAANLFLLNPNGIIFGPNAQLDIRGSFVATTADSILFDNNVAFSASDPQAPPLLTINVPIGLQYGSNATATISNRGNLSAGGNLKLGAANLDLQGQLQAGGDLTLQATDTITIRDSETNPFIAAANGQLLVQGNEKVDIFALNHPDSGLYSGGDMVFRSANAVGGDAHYWSGGNFRIEDLQGNLGDLHSPYDPIIRSLGDVSFQFYVGASLHIFAAGSVIIPVGVQITGPDTNGLGETFTLSDGSSLSIDGQTRPTLDIRAGMDPAAVGAPFFNPANFFPNTPNFILPNPPNLTATTTNADIKIGEIQISQPNGQVLLTNQYQNYSNPSLPSSGDIQVNKIGVNGGSITIDSRLNATLNQASSNFLNIGNGGIITILANGNIITSKILSSSKQGNGGEIRFRANGDIINDSKIDASGFGSGGNIDLKANSNITTSQILSQGQNNIGGNVNIFSGGILNSATIDVLGLQEGGNISLIADSNINSNSILAQSKQGVGGNISLLSGGSINSNNILNTSGLFGAGNIALLSNDNIMTTDIISQSKLGIGGNINILTNLNINARSNINTSGLLGGNIEIISEQRDIVINNSYISSVSTASMPNITGGNITFSANSVISRNSAVATLTSGAANSGNIQVNAASIDLEGKNTSADSGGFLTRTRGTGNSGNITVTASQILLQDGAQLNARTEGQGRGGNITVNADKLAIRNSQNSNLPGDTAGIYSNTVHLGDAGDITIDATSVDLDRGFLFANTFRDNRPDASVPSPPGQLGNGGNITLKVEDLTLRNGALISAASQSEGRGGNLTIDASNFVEIIGSSNSNNPTLIFLDSVSSGDAGKLTIKTGNLQIRDGASVRASSSGSGRAGDISITARDAVQILGVSPNGNLASSILSETQGAGNGGDLSLQARQLVVKDGGQISARTAGTGNAGTLTVNASESVQVTGRSGIFQSGLFFDSFNAGDAGELKINTERLLVEGGARVSAGTSATGRGGILEVNATDSVRVSGAGSRLYFDSTGAGDARGIRINTGDLQVENGGGITVNGTGTGLAGDLDITANSIFLNQQGNLLARTVSGEGGNIRLRVAENVLLRFNSNILTEALGQGNGGNITIDAGGFVLAVLPENSDVAATAIEGRGGNIFVRAKGVFGFSFPERLVRTPESDISAGSELGIDGATTINVLDFQPIVNLPDRFVDPQLNEGCPTNRRSTDFPSDRSEFFVTGRGGLPPHPTDMLGTTTVEVPFGISDEQEATSAEVVEATGWVELPDGRLFLAATMKDQSMPAYSISCGSR